MWLFTWLSYHCSGVPVLFILSFPFLVSAVSTTIHGGEDKSRPFKDARVHSTFND